MLTKDQTKSLISDINQKISALFAQFKSVNDSLLLDDTAKIEIQAYFKSLFALQTLTNKNAKDIIEFIDHSDTIQIQPTDKKYELLYRSGLILNTSLELNDLLNTAMDTIIDMTGAGRGILALVESDGTYSSTVARNADKETVDKTMKEMSDTVINRAIKNHKEIQFIDQFDNSLLEKSSIMRTGAQPIVCVPVIIDTLPRAIIYLDHFKELTYDTYELVQSFCKQLAGFIQNSEKLKQSESSHEQINDELRRNYHFEHIIGKSSEMVQIFKTIAKVADTVATILIQGESGTGKDLIARAIHINSSRKDKKFVEIDCGALPSTLIESELFGHKKGAFTGAQNDKIGLLEAADGGTIFLDEINNMPSETQAKLLRALQTKKIRRIGETDEKDVDFRLIVASSRVLKDQVEQGNFREDLFYRINTISLILPPLRERKSDIVDLAMFFIKKYSVVYGKKIHGLESDYLHFLESHQWNGNVRELEHVIERSIILSDQDKLHIDTLPHDFATKDDVEENTELSLEDYLNEKKKIYIKRILTECKGKKVETAKRLGIDRSYLFTLIKKLGIEE